MSYEAWGEPEESDYDHLLEAGWLDADQADGVKQAVSDLFAETLYEGGQMANGISVRFLARMTLLKVAVGMEPDSSPLAIEAKNIVAQEPTA